MQHKMEFETDEIYNFLLQDPILNFNLTCNEILPPQL